MASLEKIQSQFEALRLSVQEWLDTAQTPTERHLMAQNVRVIGRQNSLAGILNVPAPAHEQPSHRSSPYARVGYAGSSS